jgi:hypothetical protein
VRLPTLQGLLLIALVMASPRRINTGSRAIRLLGLTLAAALLSLANAWSVVPVGEDGDDRPGHHLDRDRRPDRGPRRQHPQVTPAEYGFTHVNSAGRRV